MEISNRVKNGNDDLKNIKDSLIHYKSSFTIKYIGSVIEFKFDSTGKTKRLGGFTPKKGMHIPKMVLGDVKKRIENGDYLPINSDPLKNVPTIMYNHENITRNLRQHCVAVDINYCYWNTAKNLGVISDRI